jgi:hypothetical protein
MSEPGTSIQSAIEVTDPGEEYEWLGRNPCACGGSWQLVLQALVKETLTKSGTQMTDRLRLRCGTCASEHEVYFVVTYKDEG